MRLLCLHRKNGEKSEAAPAADKPVRPRKWRARLPWALVLLLLIALAATAGLPVLVEAAVNRILADIARKNDVVLTVRRITLFRTDLAADARHAVRVENVSLEYAPWRLLVRRHIDRISVHGVVLFAECGKDGFRLPLLDIFAREKDAPPAPEEYLKLSTRVVDLHPITLIQNARTSGGGTVQNVPNAAVTVGPMQTWKAKQISIWHPGHHDNPFGQRLSTYMISQKIADSAVPMSLLSLHDDVVFNFYRGGFGVCEVEMH